MNVTSPKNHSLARRAVLGALLVGASATALVACAPENPEIKNDGSGKGFIAGDGSVSLYEGEDRSDPVSFTAKTFDDTTVDSSTWTAPVTVLNFWYAACAPCRTEAPTLKKLSDKFAAQKVQFVGVNIRDEKAAAEAFDRTFGLTYPSIRDVGDSGVLQALSSYVPPQAVPTTLVLDKDRRVVARILGVADESVLNSIITDTLAESK